MKLLLQYGKTNISLYGPPGSGKSTIAKLLSEKIGLSLIDVDDDILEKNWGVSVAEKLEKLGDEEFLKAEEEETIKINCCNSIISLTGSNALSKKTMDYIKSISIVLYIDVDKEIILSRANEMKIDRVVGQKDKSFSDILDYRKKFYIKNYDFRVIVGKQDSNDEILSNILNLLNREMGYLSTRNQDKTLHDFNDVIHNPIDEFKGLFLPVSYQIFSISQLERLVDLKYHERCFKILETFPLCEEVKLIFFDIIQEIYSDSNFFSDEIIPIVNLKNVMKNDDNNIFIAEQFYGKTASFKDLALEFFSKICFILEKNSSKVNIISSTSGDTGSAVMNSFSKLGFKTFILYPNEKISNEQEKHLLNYNEKPNCYSISINSNFDECQSLTKSITTNDLFLKKLDKIGEKIIVANSISWGRLMPQIFYSFNIYLDLVKVRLYFD
jgi:shikimate kinase